ncbi:MAG: glycosyltransferase family 4 protein [Acidobacteria bacterium]|nr:glycosyltransferase family 4 protein [Acidobacteriota bacterium]
MRSEVVVYTRDVVGRRMAGPGIRAFHLADEIAHKAPVTLVAELAGFEGLGRFKALQRGTGDALDALRTARVVIGQPTRELLRLTRRPTRVVFDLFDPVVLELPVIYAGRTGIRGRAHQWIEWQRLQRAMREGDLLVCATPQQFSFYAGVHLSAGGESDGWREKWLTVPFGVESRDTADDGPVEQLGDEPLVVWGGGSWPWLDPETALEAVERLRASGTKVKLLMLGGRRPNEGVAEAATSGWARTMDTNASVAVLRNREWIPYRERARWLRACSVAIMLHRESLEAEFAIRTRLFDAIWCGIPVVATRGGFAAELVEREGLGCVVAPGDVADVAAAIGRILGDAAFHASCVANLERMRERFSWNRVTAPLLERIVPWL